MTPARFFAIALSAAAPGAQAEPAPAAVIPLARFQAKQFTMQATIAGHTRTFLFDTGEGVTMISPAVAADIGCHPWGNVTGFRMLGERIDTPRCDNVRFGLPGGPFRAPETIVYDLGHIAGNTTPPLDGAIGLDLFAETAVTIDLAALAVIIESPASLAARIRAATAIPVRLVRDAEGAALSVDIGVPTSRGLAWMEWDTGNTGPTMFVSQQIAPLLNLDASLREPNVAPRQKLTATLAPGVTLSGYARVFPRMIMDGNIGTQTLQGWTITIDLPGGRAWLTRSHQTAPSDTASRRTGGHD